MIEKEKLIPIEDSGLTKLLKVVQKFLAKEFLCLLIFIIIGFPICVLILFAMANLSGAETSTFLEGVISTDKEYGGKYSFFFIYVITLIGLYFSRLVFSSIKTLTQE